LVPIRRGEFPKRTTKTPTKAGRPYEVRHEAQRSAVPERRKASSEQQAGSRVTAHLIIARGVEAAPIGSDLAGNPFVGPVVDSGVQCSAGLRLGEWAEVDKLCVNFQVVLRHGEGAAGYGD
jgi:hypothetical protein